MVPTDQSVVGQLTYQQRECHMNMTPVVKRVLQKHGLFCCSDSTSAGCTLTAITDHDVLKWALDLEDRVQCWWGLLCLYKALSFFIAAWKYWWKSEYDWWCNINTMPHSLRLQRGRDKSYLYWKRSRSKRCLTCCVTCCAWHCPYTPAWKLWVQEEKPTFHRWESQGMVLLTNEIFCRFIRIGKCVHWENLKEFEILTLCPECFTGYARRMWYIRLWGICAKAPETKTSRTERKF